ncbi:MAG: glycoside hydrolase family 44 protein [Pseudomonadota bacterium]
MFTRLGLIHRLALCLTLGLANISHAGSSLTVFDDALAASFQNWSWADNSLENSSPVHSGNRSISMEPDNFEGLYLRSEQPLAANQWGALRFHYHGGPSGGQAVRVYLQLGESFLAEAAVDPAPAGDWQAVVVDFAALGVTGSFDGIIFQDTSGGDQSTVFLDSIELTGGSAPPAGEAVSITVNPESNRRAIDPRIYGVNFGTQAQLEDLRWPVRRWGGNSTTRHNWRRDVFNTASDYFYQNIVNEVADEGALPVGSSTDTFVRETLAAGAAPILTVPTIGWTALDVREKRWGFSQQVYGPQTNNECILQGFPFWCTEDSGNGLCDPSQNNTAFCSAAGQIVGNNPADTSQQIGPPWVADWVSHLTDQFGTAAQGGPRLWAMDNEPMLWNSTHRDIRPDGLDYDGLWDRTLAYARAIKAVDPDAQILGPVVWGWCAYFTSAADTERAGSDCLTGPDRAAHDNLPLIEWYLDQVCSHEADTGFRAVDYLDIHYYPQGILSGIDGDGEDPANAAHRLRSTRELWDPGYVSETWINQPVRLIPRMREWIDQRCPGTGLALTEYRWGADDGVSSALAQVEVLALLGREGVDLATRWVAPEPGTLVEDAFRLFLNYDGSNSALVGTSVMATSSDESAVTAYAIEGSDQQLAVILINKDTALRPAAINWPAAGQPRAFRLASEGLSALSSVVTSKPLELPGRSATLIISTRDQNRLFLDGFED